jgi:hypothetical protein
MERQLTMLRSGLSCYLFIYVVRDEQTHSYCTVLAYGRDLQAAESVAINRVHQQGLHIVRADTATAAPWLDSTADGSYLDELVRYGCALHLDLLSSAAAPATAA